jgi:hypothetical protein
VSYWYDTDGSLIFKARLPALGGAMLIKALESALNDVPTQEQPQPHKARRADALALLAEAYLHTRSERASSDHHQVIVHVDAETLRERTAGRCHIEHGPTLPVETVRRLTCDASVVRITETEAGEPLDVGRKTRTIPPPIGATSMPITSSIGPTAARPSYRTSSTSAAPTIGWSTRAVSRSSPARAAGASCGPMAANSQPTTAHS